MSTDRPSAQQIATFLLVFGGTLAVVLTVGLLLREHGPGNMGNGLLLGAALGLVLAAVMGWRLVRRPERVTTFERAWSQTGDERDDAVLTRALAVLGLASFPLTAVAAIAMINNAVANNHSAAGESASEALAAGLAASALFMAVWSAAGIALIALLARYRPLRPGAVDRAAAAASTTHTITAGQVPA